MPLPHVWEGTGPWWAFLKNFLTNFPLYQMNLPFFHFSANSRLLSSVGGEFQFQISVMFGGSVLRVREPPSAHATPGGGFDFDALARFPRVVKQSPEKYQFPMARPSAKAFVVYGEGPVSALPRSRALSSGKDKVTLAPDFAVSRAIALQFRVRIASIACSAL